jgi:hypothetical protein
MTVRVRIALESRLAQGVREGQKILHPEECYGTVTRKMFRCAVSFAYA